MQKLWKGRRLQGRDASSYVSCSVVQWARGVPSPAVIPLSYLPSRQRRFGPTNQHAAQVYPARRFTQSSPALTLTDLVPARETPLHLDDCSDWFLDRGSRLRGFSRGGRAWRVSLAVAPQSRPDGRALAQRPAGALPSAMGFLAWCVLLPKRQPRLVVPSSAAPSASPPPHRGCLPFPPPPLLTPSPTCLSPLHSPTAIMSGLSAKLQPVLDSIKARNPNEPEFLQAAEEILHSLGPVVEAEGGDKFIPGTVVIRLSCTLATAALPAWSACFWVWT